MKKSLFILLTLANSVICISAQTVSDVSRNINSVKRDTMFIYAETTMKNLDEAYNGARAILEMKVGDWVRSQHPDEEIEVCIVKAKEHFLQLETRRGDFYRAFVYVNKNDIMPVSDKKEVTVFEVAPVTRQKEVIVSPAIIISEEAVEDPTPSLVLTTEERRMLQVRSFYEVEPYIKELKNNGHLKGYGKYATLPVEGNCHLFVYDKQGNIMAILRKNGLSQYNLNTRKEDDVKNYKNCGAIWFQLK